MHIVLPVTIVTAAALALINLWLAIRVGRIRLATELMIGDGGNERLTARMRAHANLTEYAPFALILIGLIELATGTSIWLWAAAAAFVLGRLLHPFGMDGWRMGRAGGIGLTWLVLAGLAVYAATLPFHHAPAPDAAPIELAPTA